MTILSFVFHWELCQWTEYKHHAPLTQGAATEEWAIMCAWPVAFCYFTCVIAAASYLVRDMRRRHVAFYRQAELSKIEASMPARLGKALLMALVQMEAVAGGGGTVIVKSTFRAQRYLLWIA